MSRNSIIEKIQFELSLIDQEFKETISFFDKIKSNQPDIIELRAIASTLHSVYNGIEKVLFIIAKDIDGEVYSDDRWHKALLATMGKLKTNRGKVLSENCINELLKYLSFRHYYRHAYGFTLDWEQMKPLCDNIHQVYKLFKSEILNFVEMI